MDFAAIPHHKFVLNGHSIVLANIGTMNFIRYETIVQSFDEMSMTFHEPLDMGYTRFAI